MPITLEDLVEIPADAPELEPIDYVAIYERCRESIQRVAAEKLSHGRIEDGGIIVHTEDLEHEHGKHGSHQKIASGYWVEPKSGRYGPTT